MVLMVSLYLVKPFLTSLNIRFTTFYSDDTDYGILLFILTIVCAILFQIVMEQMIYRFTIFGITLENSLTMMIFQKSLKYSSLALK